MQRQETAPLTLEHLTRSLAAERPLTDTELVQQSAHHPLDLLIAQALELLRQQERRRWQRIKLALLVEAVAFLSLLGVKLLLVRGVLTKDSILLWDILLGLFAAMVGMGFVYILQIINQSGRGNLLRLVLMRPKELGSEQVPLLIALLDTNPLKQDNFVGGNYYRVRLELFNLLPRLTTDQCRALTEPERSYLRTWLRRGTAEEKIRALLTLATAGDALSLPLAEKLLQDTDIRVVEAARELVAQGRGG